jgi:NADH-quinone oxidoreductase subunit G
VILWGERLTSGVNGAQAARSLLAIAERLGIASTDGAGLLEIPAGANGRGLREAGVLPNAGAGFSAPDSRPGDGAGQPGADAAGIARALAEGELSALYLLHCDPVRELADPATWESALARASSVIAHAAFLTEAIAEHADVVFPSESYAEKEGTITHPDGRLQRLRPAIARPGAVRAGWQVLAELALGLGLDVGVASAKRASEALFEAVPFYRGLTLEAIGGRGVRWQELPGAVELPAPSQPAQELLRERELEPVSAHAGQAAGYRSLWDAPEVEFSPALRFLFPRARPRKRALEVSGR